MLLVSPLTQVRMLPEVPALLARSATVCPATVYVRVADAVDAPGAIVTSVADMLTGYLADAERTLLGAALRAESGRYEMR